MLTAGSPLSILLFPQLHPLLSDTELACVGIDLKGNAEGWLAAALPWATPGEHARARRFHQRMDAVRHLVGRALTRALLSRELGVARVGTEFVANHWGKPALPGSGMEFSISHSGDAVWVAVSRGIAVGIDVENEVDISDPHALAEIFHPDERAALLASPAAEVQRTFFRCWTRKEAVIKAVGEGLSRPLSSFRVRTDQRADNWLREVPENTDPGWTSADLPVATGYHASVAAMAPNLTITCLHPTFGDPSAPPVHRLSGRQ